MAPTFYSCAFSLTKYVGSRIGVAETIDLVNLLATLQRSPTGALIFPPDGVLPRIESLLKQTMAKTRADWLASIGYSR